MSPRTPRPGRIAAVATALAALALTGCQATAESEPVETTRPIVLTMAHIDASGRHDPAATWFVDRVAKLSEGRITVRLEPSCCGGEPDVEAQLVDEVAAGSFDLGWVGTRVFTDLGVPDLNPLTAPMLIDSYALQTAVLSSDAAAEALGAVAELGVEPLALGPGLLRYPLADAPLGAPADWQGVSMVAFRSAQTSDALALLGAEALVIGFDERNAGLDAGSIRAVENSLLFVEGFEQALPVVTLDVRLWPRTSALIAAPGTAEALGEDGVEVLQAAAAGTLERSGEFLVFEQTAIMGACPLDVTFATAGDDALAELRAAFEPILSGLRDDPATAPLLEEIEALKSTTDGDEPPNMPPGCGADG